MNIRNYLETAVNKALLLAGAPKGSPAIVKQSGRVEFGHYQANGVMSAAKELKMNPRDLAARVTEHLDLGGRARSVDVAGPGFINIHLSPPPCSPAILKEDPWICVIKLP